MATIRNRAKCKCGCPFCQNRKICLDNCLATLKPEWLIEWNYERNGDLKPTDIGSNYCKKVWWKCKKGHEYQKEPIKKTDKKSCPYCHNRITCLDNCLATLKPELATEWNYEKNYPLTPYDVHSCSKKVWWICSTCKYEWSADLLSRWDTRGRGCPYCDGKKVRDDNNLVALNPEWLSEWNYGKNGDLKPADFLLKSNKEVWWKCKKGHEWPAIISSRTYANCPYCGNKKTCLDNCLATLKPELAAEWDYEKNYPLTPYNVSRSKNKHWWVCSTCKHEWKSVLYDRWNGVGCPVCKSSHGEKKIMEVLKTKLIEFVSQKKFPDCKNINLLPFDFYFIYVGQQCVIEFHGMQHYQCCDFFGRKTPEEDLEDLQHRDKIKKNYCLGKNINFLEISYKDINSIEKIIDSFLESISIGYESVSKLFAA